MEVVLVVARRSWYEIYLRKTGKYRKKEKGAYKKEERWHPNSRAQPPRIEYTQLAPSDNRSTKSADGRVATGAAWLKGRNSQGGREEKKQEKEKKQKNTLDSYRPSHGRTNVEFGKHWSLGALA